MCPKNSMPHVEGPIRIHDCARATARANA
jgi:hypothetical protein